MTALKQSARARMPHCASSFRGRWARGRPLDSRLNANYKIAAVTDTTGPKGGVATYQPDEEDGIRDSLKMSLCRDMPSHHQRISDAAAFPCGRRVRRAFLIGR